MSRKLFVAGLLALACTVTLYARSAAADEAPAPRPAAEGEKKPAKADKGKFGGFGGGFDRGNFDPAKLKEQFGKGGFGKGEFDPAKLKEKFGKEGGFGKGGFPGGKEGFPGGRGGSGGKGKKGGQE